MSDKTTEKRQTPVFMLNNVNGAFSLAFNNEFRELLVGASKEYLELAEGESPVVSTFNEALKKLQECQSGVDYFKYVETREEEKQWQPSMYILAVVNGSFFLSCNGSFGRALMDIVDASADEDGTLALPLYALVQSLDKQINYKRGRTGTDG